MSRSGPRDLCKIRNVAQQDNYRIFVEKLPRFRVEAESLRRELMLNLNLELGEVRLRLRPVPSAGNCWRRAATVFGEVVTP